MFYANSNSRCGYPFIVARDNPHPEQRQCYLACWQYITPQALRDAISVIGPQNRFVTLRGGRLTRIPAVAP